MKEALSISIYSKQQSEELETFFSDSYENYNLSVNIEAKPKIPDIELNISPKYTDTYTTKRKNINKYLILPQKLDQPIYRFPDEILSSIEMGKRIYFEELPDIDNLQLDALYNFCSGTKSISGVGPLIRFYNILVDQKVILESNQEIALFAKHLTEDELEMAMSMDTQYKGDKLFPDLTLSDDFNIKSSIMTFLHVLRIKYILEYGRKKDVVHKSAPFTTKYESHIEYDGVSYITTARYGEFEFKMMVNQKYFVISFEDISIINYQSHLNYFVTISDTKLVSSLLLCSSEYKNTHNLIKFLESTSLKLLNDQSKLVQLMSNIESLSLYIIDLCDTKYCSHISLIDTLANIMNSLSIEVTENRVYHVWRYLISGVGKLPVILSELIDSMKLIKLKQLGTVSSIHKYLGISEIVYTKGWTKYHNRTGDRYDTNPEYMNRLKLLFKYEFVRGYYDATGELPKFKYENDEVIRLRQLVRDQGINAFTLLRSLNEWTNIEIYSTLVPCQFDDVTPHLKDKACTVDYYDPYSGSAVKELIAYLDQEDNKPDDILEIMNTLAVNQTQRSGRDFIVTNDRAELDNFICNNTIDRYLMTTRLVAKEKEQKEEGRYFGIAPYRLKIALSRMMELVKRAIKYFRDQIMTLTDTGRKNKIFEAGQTLMEKDAYSLMIDISGHNQSMTKYNCAPLLEMIMELYGYTGYGKVCEIFERILIVQENKDLGTFYATIGQSGGIEGWMNQLWGLQSALIMRLFTYDYNLSVDHILTYSDDINAIVRLKNANPNNLITLFKNCSDFYKKFGQLIKIRQTQVTGSRVTMLKNHFIHGYQSETTIKRILSFTIMSSKYYYSEQVESESINATTASCLENTTMIYTTIFLRNLLLGLIGVATFNRFLQTTNDQHFKELLDKRILVLLNQPIELKSVVDNFYEYNNGQSYEIKLGHDIYYVICEDGIASVKGRDLKDVSDEKRLYLNKLLILSQYKNTRESSIVEYFFRIAREPRSPHKMLWYYKMMTPVSMGGFGIIPLQDQIISGHSESRPKIIAFFEKVLRRNDIDADAMRKLIYQHYYINEHSDKTESLVSSMSPTYNTLFGYKDIIKQTIVEYLHDKAYRNVDVKKYMDLYTERSNVVKKICEINREKFTFRIVRKYVDVSHITLIEQFIQKLEHSNTVFKLASARPTEIIMRIFHTSVKAQNELYNLIYDIKHKNYASLNPELNLYNIKRSNFPDYKFNDIVEPTYDLSLIEQLEASHIYLIPGSIYRMTKNGPKYHDPMYNKSVKPKYQLKYEMNYHFQSPAEYKVFEAVRFTKWVIHASKQDINYINSKSCNITNTCNYVVSFYTDSRYKDLSQYVLTPTGGQIFHRTDNQGFRSNSSVKIAPNLSGSIIAEFTSTYKAGTGGIDSNVNYDYLRCRLVSLGILRRIYSRFTLTTGFIMNTHYDHSTMDVRINFCTPQDSIIYKPKYRGFKVNINESKQRVFETISMLLSNGLDLEDIDMTAINMLDKLPTMDILEHSLIMLYRDIKLFIGTNKYICYDMLDSNMKRHFMTYIDPEDYQLKRGRKWDMRELDKFIEKRMSSERDRIILYQGSIDKAAMQYITNKYEARLKSIERMAIHISTFKSILKVKNFFHSVMTLLIIYQFLIFQVYIEDEYQIIRVNKEATKRNYLKSLDYLKINRIGISNIPIFKKMFELYNTDYFVQDIDLIMDKVMLESNNWRMKSIRVDAELDQNPINERFYITKRPVYHTFNYNMMSMNPYNLLHLDKEKGTIEWYTASVKNHCSLKAFTSPTGSQSLQSQYNLFRCLIADDRITLGSVADLCAGRGDGHLALTKLNVPHISVTRDDIYDRISCVADVIIDKHLDVLNYRTISDYMTPDTVMLDISFTKGSGDIWETVLHILNVGKNVIIRLNHLSSPSIEQVIKLCEFNCFFVQAEQSRDTSYHMYVVFTESKYKVKYTDNDGSDSIYDIMRSNALNFKKFDIFDVDMDTDIIVDSNMYIDRTYLHNRQNALTSGFWETDDYYKAQVYDDILHICLELLQNMKFMDYRPVLNFRPKDYPVNLNLINIDCGEKYQYKQDYSDLVNSSRKINDEIFTKGRSLKDVKINNWANLETYNICAIRTIEELTSYIKLCKVSHCPKEYCRFLITIKQLYLEHRSEEIDLTRMNSLIKDIIAKIGFNTNELDEFNNIYRIIIDSLIIAKSFGDMNAIRQAYVFCKRQYGMNNDRKLSDSLFYFRCIANKVLRELKEVDMTDWCNMSNVFFKGKRIRQSDVKKLSETDFTPAESYLDVLSLEKIIGMFGVNTMNHSVIDHKLNIAIEETRLNIIPHRSETTNFLSSLLSEAIETIKREKEERLANQAEGDEISEDEDEYDEYDEIEIDPETGEYNIDTSKFIDKGEDNEEDYE